MSLGRILATHGCPKTFCVPDSNEKEEVVSSVQGKQNKLFLDLNTHPPVDETSPVYDSPC
ncbi:hypothetical protein Hanom_Chr01g00003921 [Helianthus anomalus]